MLEINMFLNNIAVDLYDCIFLDAKHWHIFIIMDTVFSYLVLWDVTKVLF